MSADDGWLLRKNNQGKYVLQHYMDSSPAWPNINEGTLIFDTVESAVLAHQDMEQEAYYPSEYGLTVQI